MKKQAIFQIVNTEYEWLTNIKIDLEYSQLVPELSEEEYARLKESIASVGLYEPLILNQDRTLLDGHHRLKVVKELGWDKVNVETKIFENRIDEQIYVIETNLSRRQLIAAMRIKLSRDLHILELQKQAQKHLEGTIPVKGQKGFQPVLSSAEESIDTDEEIAKKSSTSKASVYRVKKIMNEGTLEEKALLFSGEGKINTAYEKLNSRQGNVHVSNNSGEYEWYTPIEYIEAARLTMGTIDLDPASCDAANETVKAKTYYTEEQDGLIQPWFGTVWLNPPYSQPLVSQFCDLLVDNYLKGNIKQACVLVNNATETKFYQNMLNHCSAVCFIKGRVKFVDKNGESKGTPLQGQTVLYFGKETTCFVENFSYFGATLYA